MVKAYAKITPKRWRGGKKPMPKAMPKPPTILGYITIMVKAYAKTIALPKNGMVKPVIWGINKAVMNIAGSMAWVINPIY